MTPSMLEQARKLAEDENRTMSELIREALRRYQQQQRWERIRLYGQAKADALGIEEKDVVPLIREYRREQQAKRKKRVRRR